MDLKVRAVHLKSFLFTAIKFSIALFPALLLPIDQAHAKRVALVIGNAAYEQRPLSNPVNDAQLMERTLKELGFEVQLVKDATRRKMLDALRDFEQRAREAESLYFILLAMGRK